MDGGQKPEAQIIQSTNTTELSVRFGRKAKQLLDSQEYQTIFKTRLREDSQAAGKWETQQGGEITQLVSAPRLQVVVQIF